jgi:peroxiredoxin
MRKPHARSAIMMGVLLGLTAAAWAAEDKAKDFSLPGLDGKTFALADVLGKKTVVLNFWAAWCTTCKEEIPQLTDLQKTTPEDAAVFLGVNAGDNAAKAKKFQEKNGYPYQVLLDQDKSVAKQYGITGVPQTLIINPKGVIVFRGSRPPKTLPK